MAVRRKHLIIPLEKYLLFCFVLKRSTLCDLELSTNFDY